MRTCKCLNTNNSSYTIIYIWVCIWKTCFIYNWYKATYIIYKISNPCIYSTSCCNKIIVTCP